MTARQALVGAVVVAVLSVGGGAALAGAVFNDVPPGSPFEDEIEAIAAAGITTGFSDGTYRPGSPVSRGAMAAFMGRGFSRAAHERVLYGDPVKLEATFTPAVVAEVTVQSGASGSGNGFVRVDGWINFTTSDVGACPCEVEASIISSDGAIGAANSAYAQLDDQTVPGGYVTATVPTSSMFEAPADTSLTFELRAQVFGADGAFTMDAVGALTATYVPFSDGITTNENGAGATAGAPPTGGLATRPRG